MWRYFVIIGVVVSLSSCGAKKIKLGKVETHSYQSIGNGVAGITLKLYENNTFKFDLKSIPQPESKEKSIKISEIGTYTSEGNWRVLNFKDPKFSLQAIFDPQFGDASYYKVIDKEHVRVNTSKEMLPIWGVVCEKE